jgi:hypothetical protein
MPAQLLQALKLPSRLMAALLMTWWHLGLVDCCITHLQLLLLLLLLLLLQDQPCTAQPRLPSCCCLWPPCCCWRHMRHIAERLGNCAVQ